MWTMHLTSTRARLTAAAHVMTAATRTEGSGYALELALSVFPAAAFGFCFRASRFCATRVCGSCVLACGCVRLCAAACMCERLRACASVCVRVRFWPSACVRACVSVHT